MTTPTPTLPDALIDDARTGLLLALADDELITGHRASHWTGVAPSIEEDLAFSTIAQDEINHADVWYQLALTRDGHTPTRAEVDALGLGRDPFAYRHAVLCERPPRDFGYTLARHWLYDHADAVRLDALTASTDRDIAAVATKLAHEERYHLEHADHWFWKCVRGGDEARAHLTDGLRAALPEALWLWEPLDREEELVGDGLLPAFTAALALRWLDRIGPVLDDAELLTDVLPAEVRHDGDGWRIAGDLFATPGGRQGLHSTDFTDDVWPEMTALYRAHPGATW